MMYYTTSLVDKKEAKMEKAVLKKKINKKKTLTEAISWSKPLL